MITAEEVGKINSRVGASGKHASTPHIFPGPSSVDIENSRDMEPLPAAASVLGVVAFIGTVTAAASSFMRDFRSARKEIVAIKKELSSLRALMEILADDFDDPANTELPESVFCASSISRPITAEFCTRWMIASELKRVKTQLGKCRKG